MSNYTKIVLRLMDALALGEISRAQFKMGMARALRIHGGKA